MRSTTSLSISVSWPIECSTTCFLLSLTMSRTTNCIRSKISPTGTIRIRMAPSRKFRRCLSIAMLVSWRELYSSSGRYVIIRFRLSSSRARFITSSPTICINSSSLERSTRTIFVGAIENAGLRFTLAASTGFSAFACSSDIGRVSGVQVKPSSRHCSNSFSSPLHTTRNSKDTPSFEVIRGAAWINSPIF